MTLRELPPGLAPDEAEKLRWEAYGHKHSSAVTSADALVRFIAQRGFVLTHPKRGLQFPSALEAAVGRPVVGRSFDEQTVQLEAWRLKSVGSGRLHAAAVLGGEASLASPAFHADFLALADNRDDLLAADPSLVSRGLGHDATAVYKHLAGSPQALTQAQLEERMQLRSDPGRARLAAALGEAIRCLRVCEVVPPNAGEATSVAYDMVSRACGALLRKACKIKPTTARQRIATRYLRNVLVEGCHEMAQVLGWAADETLETLRSLESRKIVSEHPASRHNRWFFQVSATDLLHEQATDKLPRDA